MKVNPSKNIFNRLYDEVNTCLFRIKPCNKEGSDCCKTGVNQSRINKERSARLVLKHV